MKRNLLFVMPNLTAGGGEKSLINLLSQIDNEKYNVDLFLFRHDGLFMEFLPKWVTLLPISETHKMFTLPIILSIKSFLLKGKISLACNRIMFSVKNKVVRNNTRREQYTWKYISKSFDKSEKQYDVAIGFLEKTSTYFCVDHVNAAKKIGWIHTDYDKLGMDPKMDINYFNKLNHIVTVSEECANILKQRFPTQQNKVDVIYNIVSPKMILSMADQDHTKVYDKKSDEIVILSIGRLHVHKGFEMAVEACRKLIDRGYNIIWNIIGNGVERERLTNLIKANQLEERFHLLGLKSNPYPYIRQADLYVQPSRFEGKSIAIEEAKIFNKPIIVTNYSTAKDQITHGSDGLIIEMNAEAVAVGIEKLINDCSLREKLIYHLSQSKLGTEDEVEKLYRLFD